MMSRLTMDRLRSRGAAKSIYIPGADRRGGKTGIQTEIIEQVASEMHDRGCDPFRDFRQALGLRPPQYRFVSPQFVYPWVCRTAGDVFAMRRHLRNAAALSGYAAVEAVYPPGCEWLAEMNHLLELAP